MSTHTRSETVTVTETQRPVTELKFEAVVIPVSDVDRAKRFYGDLGWRLDADFPFDNGLDGGILGCGPVTARIDNAMDARSETMDQRWTQGAGS